MTAPHIVDLAGLLSEALTDASPDLMIGAERGQRSDDRTAQPNGCRHLSAPY